MTDEPTIAEGVDIAEGDLLAAAFGLRQAECVEYARVNEELRNRLHASEQKILRLGERVRELEAKLGSTTYFPGLQAKVAEMDKRFKESEQSE